MPLADSRTIYQKLCKNTSILTDEERQKLKPRTEEGAQLLIASSENLKKNQLYYAFPWSILLVSSWSCRLQALFNESGK